MPNIPIVTSRNRVSGTVSLLDRSYSNVRATDEMFGAHEARALSNMATAVGSALSGLSGMGQDEANKDRAERVATAVATNPLAPTALEVASQTPPSGDGLLQGTASALTDKIRTDAERLFPGDVKAQREYRMKQIGTAGHYIQNAGVQQHNMRSQHSLDQTNQALMATDQLVRTDPTGWELAYKQGIDVINNSNSIPVAAKDDRKIQWGASLANTRFEGMLVNAKSVQDLEAIERELTGKTESGGPNDWQTRLSGDPKANYYEKLTDRIRTAKSTYASKATTEANAALEKYEKMSGDAAAPPIAAQELRDIGALVNNSNNGVAALRYSRLVRQEEIKTGARGMTPEALKTRGNQTMGGAGMTYPGIPAAVSGYIGEATTAFPGISASYLGATAIREYGQNFQRGARPAPGPMGPQPGLVERGNIDLANRPMVRDKDGSLMTVRSASINVDGKEVLIPTIGDDGTSLTVEEATAQYNKTGKHLGKFDSVKAANDYAEKLSKAQSAHYATRAYAPTPGHKGVDIANVAPHVQDNLTVAGEIFGQPLIISSGYRSQQRQDDIRNRPGADPNRASVARSSYHTAGTGVDISTAGMDGPTKARMVDALVQAGFTGFGEYDTHIHADMRTNVGASYGTRAAWGGWTSLSPEVQGVLDKRGFAAGKAAGEIDRSGNAAAVRQRAIPEEKIDYGRGTSIRNAQGVPTSTATGLYQFIEGTWETMSSGKSAESRQALAAVKQATGIDMAAMTPEARQELRKNPRISTYMAAAYAQQNKNALQAAFNREPSDAELYMAHFLGAGGATAFLRAYETDPNQIAAGVVPGSARANKPVFYTKDGTALTVAQVHNKLSAQYGANPSIIQYQDAKYYQELGQKKAEGLRNNPVAVGRNDGVIVDVPLDNNAKSWEARGQNVKKLKDYYPSISTETVKPFDTENGELANVKKTFSDGTSEDIVNMLNGMAVMDRVSPGSMSAGLEQAGQKSEAYGVAGDLMLQGDVDGAIAIVQGSKALADDTAPSQALLKQQGGVGAQDTFAKSTAQALRGVEAKQKDAIYKAANAHYVSVHAPNAKQFDPKLYEKSINAVLGGKGGDRIATVNGGKTVAPADVPAADLEKAVENLGDEDLVKLSVDREGRPNGAVPRYFNGKPAQAVDIASQGTLRYMGDAEGGAVYEVIMQDGGTLITENKSNYLRPLPYLMKLDKGAVNRLNNKPRTVPEAMPFDPSISGVP